MRRDGSHPGARLQHALHLVRRFAGSLAANPPPAADLAWARDNLDDGEWALWRHCGPRDARHTIAVARRYVELRPDAPRDEIAGALLHDVGKVASRLGTWGRVWARLVGPRTARLRAYHDHERIGAEMVRRAGSRPSTVAMVRGAALPTELACDPSLSAAIGCLRRADDST